MAENESEAKKLAKKYYKKDVVLKRDHDVASKLLTMDKVPWNTIPDAMKEIDDLRESEDEYNMDILEEIDEYIQELEETYSNILK